ncbi:MAG: sulfite exporter TauE/SafE family protein [Bacillota bacterium]|nr:sulfite exporter TauE/SafE family protein [Bacillota bacterium]
MEILTFLKNLFMLKYLPKLGNGTGYGLLFIFGLLTSFHCIGMCGGIILSQSVKKAENQESQESNEKSGIAKLSILPSLLYNLGRIISYTIVGIIVGGIGKVIQFTGIWKGVVPIIGGIFMIIMAINLIGIFPFLKKFNIRMPSFAAKKIFKGNKNYNPIIVGLLTGLMPCGPLQIVQLYALSTGSALIGGLSMFVFSLGTMPLLFTFGAINTILNKKFSKIILKLSSIIVLVMGIVMICRGLALSGVCINMSQMTDKSEGFSTINGNYQIVKTEISSDKFPPIEVVKGIPVKWTAHVKKENLNDCNNAIQIPKFEIQKSFEVGDNLIEFTPDQSGEFVYTCWMGMIKSKIKVVDTVEQLKQDEEKGGKVSLNNDDSKNDDNNNKCEMMKKTSDNSK